MSNDNNLVIDESCMYKVKVEDIEDLDKSFFKDAYVTAFKILNEIINENDKFNYNKCPLNCKYIDNQQNSDSCNNCINYKSKDKKNALDFEEVINNIISFVGERGSGKTSAMKSFVKMIKSLKTRNVSNKTVEQNIEKTNKNIYITDLIDPSTFNKNDSIIEIIVAELFKVFKHNGNIEMSERQELLKYFEKVFNDLRVLNKEKSKIFEDNFDNIDILLNLSSAISLKNNLYELIKKFLKTDCNDFLIIQIDDLDMNISAGAKMLEDLRKYLNLPNVIIIMAAKYTQLFEVVKQENIKYMDTLYKYTKDMEGEKEAFAEEINNKTDKYLEKLIPVSRRIYLPEVSINNTDISLKLDVKVDNHDKAEKVSVKIRRLFYEKLRIVIVTDKAAESIIPKNLRSFIQFVKLLYDLKNLDDKYDEEYNICDREVVSKTVLKSNIEKFKNMISEGYIFNTGSLSRHGNSKLLYCKIEQLNRLIVEFINNQISNDIKRYNYDKENDIYKKYIYYVEQNKIYLKEQNISYGDVITWIAIYEGLNIQENERRTIEFVKIICSIRFMEALCKDSFSIDKINGPDFIGNYFDITNSINPRGTKAFKEQVQFPDKINKFSININSIIYEAVLDYYKKQNNNMMFRIQEIKTGEKSTTLYNVDLSDVISLYNKYKDQSEDIDNTELEITFGRLIENIYYYYSALEYRKEKDLERFVQEEKYFNIYENWVPNVGFHKKYYFKAFNIIMSYIFRDDMNNIFCDKLGITQPVSISNYALNRDEAYSIDVFLLNLDFFMNLLFEITHKLNRRRPSKSYENRLDFWLDIIFKDSFQEMKNKIEEYREIISESYNKNTYKKLTINTKEKLSYIINDSIGTIRFIKENIFIDSRSEMGILGMRSIKNDDEEADIINKMINYVEKKRSNNTTAGSSIDGQLRTYLNKMFNAAADNNIIKEYYERLNEVRKKFINTDADTDERNKVTDEFIAKLNELKENLK